MTAISRRWTAPETAYRDWYEGRARNNFRLGEILVVPVDPPGITSQVDLRDINGGIFVANMIAQHGYSTTSKGPPIRYGAVRACLRKLLVIASELDASVHMPRIGCGLAGGRWEYIEPIVREQLVDNNIRVIVYDYR